MARKHNLLFIYTDQQLFNTLAAYGNELIEMPNLNRFAAESVVFERAYCTEPICTPARASLLTGLYPHTHGCVENNMVLDEAVPCLPEMLDPGAYATAHYGKWHLGDECFAQHGFRDWISTEDGYHHTFRPGRDPDRKSTYHDYLTAAGFRPAKGERFSRAEAARLPEAHGKPAFLARAATRFIAEHRDDPFILYVNFLEPHAPYHGPRDAQYQPGDIPLPDNFDAPPSAAQPLKARMMHARYQRFGREGQSLRTAEEWQQLMARYWGLCSLVDTHVGSILHAVDEAGLRDHTAIVFTSDHGDMMGAHRLLTKFLMFEESVRVPLMIRYPGQTTGKRVAGPVSHIDLLPTLLELLEAPIPGHLQGRSLCPLMTASSPAASAPVFIEWNWPSGRLSPFTGTEQQTRALVADDEALERVRQSVCDPVRTVISPDGWKLNISTSGEDECYDLNRDPGETVNRFHDPETQAIRRELTARLRQWKHETNDPAPAVGDGTGEER